MVSRRFRAAPQRRIQAVPSFRSARGYASCSFEGNFPISTRRLCDTVPVSIFGKYFCEVRRTSASYATAQALIARPHVLPRAFVSQTLGKHAWDFEVLRLHKDGRMAAEKLGVADLLRFGSLHARDVVSLGLHASDRGVGRRCLPLLLPRGEAIVISLDHMKAIITVDSMVLFDADRKGVKAWVEAVAEGLRLASALPPEQRLAEAPFELMMLEECLRDVCETYQKRVRLYRPLVDALLPDVEQQNIGEQNLPRIVILKDSLTKFELDVTDLISVIESMLHNDEDMLGCMLTARAEAKKRGKALDGSYHAVVELLLENYHRELQNTLIDIVSMRRLVQAKQELGAISVDLHRNRLVQMNVQLSICAMGLSIGTTIAGFLGMNVPLPEYLSNSPTAFAATVGFSTALGVGSAMVCQSYLNGSKARDETRQRVEEIHALHSIVGDLSKVDYALKQASGAGNITKSQFASMLQASSDTGDISEREVDLLFRAIDRSGDGLLQPAEFQHLTRSVNKGSSDAKKALDSDQEERARHARIRRRHTGMKNARWVDGV